MWIKNQSRKPRAESLEIQSRRTIVASTASRRTDRARHQGITSFLGDDDSPCSSTSARRFPKDSLLLPGPDYVDRAYGLSDDHRVCWRACSRCSTPAGWRDTGYVSILPVDQGIEHSAGASFAPNPAILRSGEHREAGGRRRLQRGRLDVRRAGHRCAASTRTRFPFIVKINHNEFMTYPNKFDQMFGRVQAGIRHGRGGGRRDDLFRLRGIHAADRGSRPRCSSRRTSSGMATMLWCYLRNPAFKTKDRGLSRVRRSHRPGQSPGRHDPGRHHQAEAAGEQRRLQRALNFGKTHKAVYRELTTDNPIDLTRYQVANCYMGRAGLINSGGASSGEGDLAEAVRPPSSTSAPAAWASSPDARRFSGR